MKLYSVTVRLLIEAEDKVGAENTTVSALKNIPDSVFNEQLCAWYIDDIVFESDSNTDDD